MYNPNSDILQVLTHCCYRAIPYLSGHNFQKLDLFFSPTRVTNQNLQNWLNFLYFMKNKPPASKNVTNVTCNGTHASKSHVSV